MKFYPTINFYFVLFASLLATSVLAGSEEEGCPADFSRIALSYKARGGTGGIYGLGGDRHFRKIINQTLIPKSFLDPDNLSPLKGKVVVDLGAGTKGYFVHELENDPQLLDENGHSLVTAIAVDAKATGRDGTPANIMRANAAALPLRDQSVDIIFSWYSIFFGMYIDQESPEFIVQALKECHRVLKTGGVVRIAPTPLGTMEEFVKQVPGLKVTVSVRRNHMNGYMEITRVD